MRFLIAKTLIVVCAAMCMNSLFVNAAAADFATYVYRGNNFEEVDGEPGVFSTKDRVTGHFTVDCSTAHAEGTCANLPYDNYFWLGAVTLETVYFSAGPASLPTVDGHADVNAFWFSTDANGQIVDWDIDLTFFDPSGIINVDTDNKSPPIDSAAALGGGAVVFNNPGRWKKVGSPGKYSRPFVNDNNRTYGSSAGGGHCEYIENRTRCWDVHATEDYDTAGTFENVEVAVSNYYYRYRPHDGSWSENHRYLSCPVDQRAISAHPNHVTLDVTLDASTPGCQSYGFRRSWDPVNGYQYSPYEFFGLTVISGEWLDPMTTGKAVINRRDSYYDPWSDTTNEMKLHCNEDWGEMMSKGGFAVSGEAPYSQTSHIFEGYDPSGWSSFNVVRCNEGNKLN